MTTAQKPVQLVPVRLVAKFLLYLAAEATMTVSLFFHYLPAGFFALGFFIWIDLFTGKTIDALRGKTDVPPHTSNG